MSGPPPPPSSSSHSHLFTPPSLIPIEPLLLASQYDLPDDISPAPVPPPHRILSSERPLVPFDPCPTPTRLPIATSTRTSSLHRSGPSYSSIYSYSSGYSSHYGQQGSTIGTTNSSSVATASAYRLRTPPPLPSPEYIAEHSGETFKRTTALHRYRLECARRTAPAPVHDEQPQTPPHSPPPLPPPHQSPARTSPVPTPKRASVQRLHKPGLPSVVEVTSSQERENKSAKTIMPAPPTPAARVTKQRDLPEPPYPPLRLASPVRRYQPVGTTGTDVFQDTAFNGQMNLPSSRGAKAEYDSRLPRRISVPPSGLRNNTPDNRAFGDSRIRYPGYRGNESLHTTQQNFGSNTPSHLRVENLYSPATAKRFYDQPGDATPAAYTSRLPQAKQQYGLPLGGSRPSSRNTNSAGPSEQEKGYETPRQRARIQGPREPAFKLRAQRSDISESIYSQDSPEPGPSTSERPHSRASHQSSVPNSRRDDEAESQSLARQDSSGKSTSSYYSTKTQAQHLEVSAHNGDDDTDDEGDDDEDNESTPRAVPRAATPGPSQTAAPTSSPRAGPGSNPAPALREFQTPPTAEQNKRPVDDEPNWTLADSPNAVTANKDGEEQQQDADNEPSDEPTWQPSKLQMTHDTVSRTRTHYDQFVIRMYPTAATDGHNSTGNTNPSPQSQQRNVSGASSASTVILAAPETAANIQHEHERKQQSPELPMQLTHFPPAVWSKQSNHSSEEGGREDDEDGSAEADHNKARSCFGVLKSWLKRS